MQSHFPSKTSAISVSFDESGERKSAGAGAAFPYICTHACAHLKRPEPALLGMLEKEPYF